ncbi:MAG: hypothetical protein RL536_233 [Candidatus Parcubacteria bacterium]|jgi:hypothetical protein
MNALYPLFGQLFALVLVLYLFGLGFATIAGGSTLAGRFNKWYLKMIGRGVRRLAKLMVKGVENFFKWVHSKL